MYKFTLYSHFQTNEAIAADDLKNIWSTLNSVDDYSSNRPLQKGLLRSLTTFLRTDFANVVFKEKRCSKADGGNMKRLIQIERGIDEEDLFDGGPPHPNFWVLLLTRGADQLDAVSVFPTKESNAQPLRSPTPRYCWYPRSLLKQLLMVSERTKIYVSR